MKSPLLIILICFSLQMFGQKIPAINKTEFSKEALSQLISDDKENIISIKSILEKYKGKIIVIDFWAAWCKDCIKVLPNVKELEERNPAVKFLYFSLERSKEGFHKSIEKFNLQDKEHYWFHTGWKNAFNDYIELNWIPRYMIIDQNSNIAKYYSISPNDPEIQETIDELMKR